MESPVVEIQEPLAVTTEPEHAVEPEPAVAEPSPEVWEEPPPAAETQYADSDSAEPPERFETSLDAAGMSARATVGPEVQSEEPPAPSESAPVPPAGSGPRIRKLARPAPIEEPAAPSAATASDRATPPPAGLPYTPDTVPEHMYRRMWWKYDLRVKSNRQPPAPPAENQQ